MSKTPKQTLLGHEINRARLRILSPIGEESSLSPVPKSPQPKRDETELKYPRDHQMVLITDDFERFGFLPSGIEPSSPDLIPPVPAPAPLHEYRSRELDAVVHRYLLQTTAAKRERSHNVAYCECCENVNEVNREKRKLYWGKKQEQSEHDADPARFGLELGPYGPPPYGLPHHRTVEERPVFDGKYQLMYPTLAATGNGPVGDQDRGSAARMYPYLPDNYLGYRNYHGYPVGLDAYYNEWGTTRNLTNPPYERHLAEDVMQAATNYDVSMGRLQHTVKAFSTKKPHGSFS